MVGELWACPRCGRRFANRNQWHSCGPYTVERFLEGKGAGARRLFERIAELVASLGPFTFAPARTRVGFQRSTIFAAVNRLSDRGMSCHVVLPFRLDHPRLTRIDAVTPGAYVHHFRVASPEEVDEEVRGWLRQAYVHAGPDPR